MFSIIGCESTEDINEAKAFSEKKSDPLNYKVNRSLESFPTGICGPTNDLQHVNQYDGLLNVSKAFVDDHKRPVGAIQTNIKQKFCSGTLIGPDLFLTASHCVDNETFLDSVSFNYELDSNGTPLQEDSFSIIEVVEDGANVDLDYAIIKLAGRPGDTYGWAEVSGRTPDTNERLTVIQHPHGEPKQIETGSFYSLGGAKKIILYSNLDTSRGSSGSGVLDSNGVLIGVHTTGTCSEESELNAGVCISAIQKVSAIINNYGAVPLYQWYNPTIQDNLFTRSAASAEIYGYQYEGIAAYVHASQENGSVPLHQYWSPFVNDHSFLTDYFPNGVYGYAYEEINCYLFDHQAPGTIPIYRWWNSSTGDHSLTILNTAEARNSLISSGYTDEGVQYYVYPTRKTGN
ncbi:MAG: trypsin-like peptidase domain-containing protein [bacterium]|nr:trypsin-like peptidase domain-containing protein [bacterium]